MPRPLQRDIAVVAALALIALATLTPGAGPGGWGLGFPDPADILLNIALFVPFGMAVRWRSRLPWLSPWARPMRSLSRPTLLGRWWREPPRSAEPKARASGYPQPLRPRQASPLRITVVAAFLLSAGIELAQLSLIPGRDSSPWDLVTNVTGAVLGVNFPAHLVVLPLIPAWLASGWLLAPTAPPSPIWWGQWAHQFGSSAPFSGTIQAAELNGVPAPERSLGQPATDRMKAGFHAPPIRYRVRLNPPIRPSPDRVQVAGVADGVGGEVVGLWQIGWDLELSWHARGTRLGLRAPSVRLPGLLFLDPRLEASVDARLYSRDVTLVVSDGPHDAARQVLLGPWQGWRLLWPLDPPTPGPARWIAGLWTAVCLGVPLMLWVPRLVGTRRKPR